METDTKSATESSFLLWKATLYLKEACVRGEQPLMHKQDPAWRKGFDTQLKQG